jgi:periplasmic copper chaperone A
MHQGSRIVAPAAAYALALNPKILPQSVKFPWDRHPSASSRNGAIQMIRKSLLLAAMLTILSGAAAAETYTAGTIEVSNPWARATPKGAQVGGAFMTITNKGTEPDRLVGISSAVASKIEVHQMSMDSGVMAMRPVAGGLEIKPGQTVEFRPDSFHLMLMGLKQPLIQGQHLKATLEFAKAGKLEIDYAVEAVGAQGPGAVAPGIGHGAMPGMPGR